MKAQRTDSCTAGFKNGIRSQRVFEMILEYRQYTACLGVDCPLSTCLCKFYETWEYSDESAGQERLLNMNL